MFWFFSFRHSAAHCGKFPEKAQVGAINTWDADVGNAQWRNAISMADHPKYNPTVTGADYDFRLVKIQKVTKPHLQPVKLNSNSAVPSTGSTLTVMGMGAIDSAGYIYEDDLRWVNLKKLSHKECVRRRGYGFNGKAEFCAWAPNKDSCFGDSGGPIITAKGVQVGVVSNGPYPCADPKEGGYYARVSESMDWISKKICEMTDHPDPTFCEKQPVTFSAVVQYDEFPAQVAWYLKDLKTGRRVINMKRGSVKKKNAKITKPVNLIPGRKYMLWMQDSKRNGFTSAKKGFVNIVGKRNGKAIWRRKVSGKFRSVKVVRFTVPEL